MEDKQAICDALCKTLQLTRGGSNVVSITYGYDGIFVETVTIQFKHAKREIRVDCDSGIALIEDIMKVID